MTHSILEQVNEVAIDQEYTLYTTIASTYALNKFEFDDLMDPTNKMTLEELDELMAETSKMTLEEFKDLMHARSNMTLAELDDYCYSQYI